MTEYKVGDKVRIVGLPARCSKPVHMHGTLGTVDELYFDRDGGTEYRVKTWWYKADALDLEPADIQVGDTVSVEGTVTHVGSMGWTVTVRVPGRSAELAFAPSDVKFVSRPAPPERTVTVELTEGAARDFIDTPFSYRGPTVLQAVKAALDELDS